MITSIVNPNNSEEKYEYFLDDRLKNYLDRHVKKDLEQVDKDYVMLVDGYEGSGKSTFAFQIARYVDPSFSIDRVCMNSKEFGNVIQNAPDNTAVVYDEAEGLSGGASITKVGRLLKSKMMQMRQKHLFVIIIMPIIFEFNKYAVLSRAKAFFHIYEVKEIRGYWVGYNKRDLRNLYLQGKTSYSYRIKSFFKGRFYGKWTVNKDLYLEKKRIAFENIEEEEENKGNIQRDILIYTLYTLLGTIEKVREKILSFGLKISHGTIVNAIKRAKSTDRTDI